jgi:hypothetical protein
MLSDIEERIDLFIVTLLYAICVKIASKYEYVLYPSVYDKVKVVSVLNQAPRREDVRGCI